MLNALKRCLRSLPVAAVLFMLPSTAEAGPPLICHPFDPGSSAVLPWGSGPGWNTPDRSYDIKRLTADTLRLLSAEAPILARMENLRRATIYASQDRRVAEELLAAVVARTTAPAANASHSLAQFDAGYFIESYRQATHIYNWDMLSSAERSTWAIRQAPRGLDGYSMLLKALEAGPNPEMEFAASLMKEGRLSEDHRRKAEAGARPGSLLAKNLRK